MLPRQIPSCQIPRTLASTSTRWSLGETLFYSSDLRPLLNPIRSRAVPILVPIAKHARAHARSLNFKDYPITNTRSLQTQVIFNDVIMMRAYIAASRGIISSQTTCSHPPYRLHNGRIDEDRWRRSSI